jgi:hypothetical protein
MGPFACTNVGCGQTRASTKMLAEHMKKCKKPAAAAPGLMKFGVTVTKVHPAGRPNPGDKRPAEEPHAGASAPKVPRLMAPPAKVHPAGRPNPGDKRPAEEPHAGASAPKVPKPMAPTTSSVPTAQSSMAPRAPTNCNNLAEEFVRLLHLLGVDDHPVVSGAQKSEPTAARVLLGATALGIPLDRAVEEMRRAASKTRA